jgi:short-subunit dehydrogenase
VADALAVEQAAAAVEERFGPIDVWVNNAMVTVFSPVKEMTAADYRRVTEVTYLGFVHGTLAALRRMLPRDRGTIVQVGSALAYRAIPLQAAYCAAKHALRAFTDSLRVELRNTSSGVHVTSVHLPGLNTPQFTWVRARGIDHQPRPVAPVYQPEVAAQAIVWAAGRKRREVWVGGSTVATILANRIAPGLLDRYLARTGFKSQQTGDPKDPDQPANLFEPADGSHGHDFGAHGQFDDRSKSSSAQLWASQHHGTVGAGLAVAAASAVGVARWARAR